MPFRGDTKTVIPNFCEACRVSHVHRTPMAAQPRYSSCPCRARCARRGGGAGRGHGRGGPCAAGAAPGSRAGLPMWDSEVDAALSVLVRGWGLLAHPGCFAAAVLACLSCCCWELQLGASAEESGWVVPSWLWWDSRSSALPVQTR